MSKMVSLPAVGRIEGLVYHGPAGAPPERQEVELQYTAHTPSETWHSLKMPLLDALYLLNMLEAMSQEQGLEHLRRG